MSPYRTPWEPPREMPPPERNLVGWAMLIGCALGTVACFAVGCAANSLSDADAKTVRDYQAEQLLCVDKATTRVESQACRCEVKKRYGRPCNER